MLSKLPKELKFEIIKWIGYKPSDLMKWALLSKETKKSLDKCWKEIYIRRFGPLSDSAPEAELSNQGIEQKYYQKHLTSWKITASSLSIAHGNDSRYWEIEHVDESYSKEIRVLNFVWWFDVVGSFHGVLPGEYHPEIKLKSNSFFQSLGEGRETMRIVIKVQDDPVVSDTLFKLAPKETLGQWTRLRFPSITLNDINNVSIQIFDYESYVKMGLEIDFFQLVAISKAHSNPESTTVIDNLDNNVRSDSGILFRLADGVRRILS